MGPCPKCERLWTAKLAAAVLVCCTGNQVKHSVRVGLSMYSSCVFGGFSKSLELISSHVWLFSFVVDGSTNGARRCADICKRRMGDFSCSNQVSDVRQRNQAMDCIATTQWSSRYRGVPKFWTHLKNNIIFYVTSACARRTGAAARVERRRRER